jgi:hypothetical protein
VTWRAFGRRFGAAEADQLTFARFGERVGHAPSTAAQ